MKIKVRVALLIIALSLAYFPKASFAIQSDKKVNLALPQFEDYSSSEISKEPPKPVDLKSHPEARKFRTVLREGIKKGINFAGHLIVVEHGCGTSCQAHWVIDASTGKVKGQFMTTSGADYKPDSNLLVLNPPSSLLLLKKEIEELEREGEKPSWASEKSIYLVWNGKKLQKIKELNMYQYLTSHLK